MEVVWTTVTQEGPFATYVHNSHRVDQQIFEKVTFKLMSLTSHQ